MSWKRRRKAQVCRVHGRNDSVGLQGHNNTRNESAKDIVLWNLSGHLFHSNQNNTPCGGSC